MELYPISVGVNWGCGTSKAYCFGRDQSKPASGDWCRACMVQVFGWGERENAEPPLPTAPEPPTTIEELLRQLVREEIDNARSE